MITASENDALIAGIVNVIRMRNSPDEDDVRD
jgi:hypothetical protein